MTESVSRRPRLVLGDDGKQPSDVAWRWVTNQEWPGWYVDVLTADTGDTPIEWGKPPAHHEWTPPWARTQPVKGSVEVRFLQVATDPRAMLAELEDLDLVVLGLRTHGYLKALVTGSTTEWMLHDPPAPLVVASSPETVHRVIVCADGSGHAARAMNAFTSLPFAAATSVTVLTIDDGRTDPHQGIEGAMSHLEGNVAEIEAVTAEGAPTPTILAHLEEQMPDLVVLGTRGLTGWKRLRLGSTAAAVVRSAPCSSLVASTDIADID